MLNLGSTYLIVKDIQKSIAFYESLLEMKVSVQRFDRWAQFNFNGNCIALYNPKYDDELIKHGKFLKIITMMNMLNIVKIDKFNTEIILC